MSGEWSVCRADDDGGGGGDGDSDTVMMAAAIVMPDQVSISLMRAHR